MSASDRHSRQRLFAPIGSAGQARIENARIAIIGCGALGSHSAEMLARAGVARTTRGVLRIIDRDYVDLSNLQRQALFDQSDAERSKPKAVAAADHIRAIDCDCRVEAVVRDFNSSNAAELLEDVDLVVDGTDNYQTRFTINDAAVAAARPWIYGGAVASRGIVSFVEPGVTPCFRCLMGEIPPLGSGESCETAGIITPLPALVSALQVAAALRWIAVGTYESGVLRFDVWTGTFRRTLTTAARNPDCRSCGTRELPSLAASAEHLVTLCGRNSVQLFWDVPVSLDAAERRFSSAGLVVHRHAQSVTTEFSEGKLTLFSDGRVIVEGTTDPLEAKSIVGRRLGG
ncbi:MAG: ThiF family adenylyltransferase [Thermoanaerobaculia bacterium]